MAKRWFPGHYLMVIDDENRLGMLDSRRNYVRYEPLWAGYYGHYWWHRMELSKGVYDFSIILNDLNKAEADGKKMWVMLQNRSFNSSRGQFAPTYIETDYNGIYYHNTSGEDFSGCKLWEPAVSDRWLMFQDRALRAIRDHPALVGVATEESGQSGAWLQSGYTWQAMNAFLLEQSRRGMLEAGNLLFHNNMGWSAESGTNYDEQYRMLDTMVRTHRAGVSPNDLRMSSGTAILSTNYGKFCFDRYVGEAWHMAFVEWTTYSLPETPSQLIDFAHDRLKMPFVGWQVIAAGQMPSQTFSITDIIAAVQAKAGKIWSTKPTSVTYFDGVAPPPPPPEPVIDVPAVITADMTLFHDGPSRTLQWIPTWGSNWGYPESYAKPDGWTTVGAWGVIMADYNGAGTPPEPWRVAGPYSGNQGGNTRAQVRDMQWWWLLANGTWERGSYNEAPGGYMYHSSWAGEEYTNENAFRLEPAYGGGRSARYINMNGPNPPAYQFDEWLWHFFGSRMTVPANYVGYVSAYFARKTLDNLSGVDDRASARLLADAAGDWWITADAQWAGNGVNNQPTGYNRFKYLSNDWQLVAHSPLSEAQLLANPPPLIGVPTEPPPPPFTPITLPARGTWFAKTSNGNNAWNTHAVASTPADKIRRRRGVKLWS